AAARPPRPPTPVRPAAHAGLGFKKVSLGKTIIVLQMDARRTFFLPSGEPCVMLREEGLALLVQKSSLKSRTLFVFADQVKAVEQDSFGEEGLLRVLSEPGKGRHVVSKTSIEPGTTLLRAAALGAVVSGRTVEKICHNCWRVRPRVRCGSCKTMVFCDRSCFAEVEHHDIICAALTCLLENPGQICEPCTEGAKTDLSALDIPRLALDIIGRSMVAANNEGTHNYSVASARAAALLPTLVSHKTLIKRNERRAAASQAAALIALLPAPVQDRLQRSEVATLLLRLRFNCQYVDRDSFSCAVLALFPEAALFSHSCRPNACYHATAAR
ncbi:unnamed protein product, partial [Phaeothamnion confervicola]